MAEVFEGISVLDFSWGWPGSVATMVLSDFGADVVKVEPPGGDPTRSVPAALQWHRGKKSVILDLKSPEGRKQAQELAARADVVITSFRPGVAERLGISYDELKADHTDLIYVSISGFGPKGPYAKYKGYEEVVAAKIGRLMVFNGQSDRIGPRYPAVGVGSHAAAMATVRGITAALMIRDRTGKGQKIETSLLQGFQVYDLSNWVFWQCMMKFPELFPDNPFDNPKRQPVPGYTPIRTKDGQWLQIGSLVERPVRQYLSVLGLSHILQEERFKTTPRLLPQEQHDLRGMILEKARNKTAAEWMEQFINGDPPVAAEPYLTSEQGMDHPQMIHNGHVQEVMDPRAGKMRQIGVLSMVREAPGSIKGPAPDPGQNTQDILSRLNNTPPKAASKGNESLPKHPLAGINVLDFSSVIAGPLGCSLLSQLGARVIRIEPHGMDFMRLNNRGIATASTQAGTENVSLDLQKPEGKEIAQKLVAWADVVVNNMRPGAPERLGIGYEQLKEINPKIIYVYAAGYGSTGPHSHRPAMHPTMGAVAGGVVAQLGKGVLPSPDQEMTMDETREMARRLYTANETNPDINSSNAISTAALFGLYMRHKTGKSQYIESTMLSANAYANVNDFFSFEGRPPREISDGENFGLHALYRLYQAKNGWIFLGCPLEEEWQTLCRTIGKADLLDDPRFFTEKARRENDEALIQELAAVFAAREPLEWEDLLTTVDVACVRAEDRGLFHFFDEDAHSKENNFVRDVELPRFGAVWRYGPVVNFSETPSRVGPGPLLGQHSRPVLREFGYSEEQIEELREKKVVVWEEE